MFLLKIGKIFLLFVSQKLITLVIKIDMKNSRTIPLINYKTLSKLLN